MFFLIMVQSCPIDNFKIFKMRTIFVLLKPKKLKRSIIKQNEKQKQTQTQYTVDLKSRKSYNFFAIWFLMMKGKRPQEEKHNRSEKKFDRCIWML